MFKLTFKQEVLAGFAISLLFVLLSAVTSYLSVKQLNEDSKWQNHTYEVISQIKSIETQVLNSESSLRGFVLSQDRKYLDPYNKNAPRILLSIQELSKLIHDNTAQQDRADSLDIYGHQKVTEMARVLQTFDLQGQDAASKRIFEGVGQRLKNQMMAVSEQMIAEEFKLLKQRKLNTEQSNRRSTWVILLSSGVIFCLILYLFTYIKKTFDNQKKTEDQIREPNDQLAVISGENEFKNWLLASATAIIESTRGEQEIQELSNNVTSSISTHINAAVGAFFLINRAGKTFKYTGGYAYRPKKGFQNQYHYGEGLVGQVALEGKVKLLTDIPSNYIHISSGLGDVEPTHLFLLPIQYQKQTLAVIEFGLYQQPEEKTMLLLNAISESIGVAINSALARIQMRALFEETQQQAEELESQQEELRTTNEELMYKTDQLQASEEELRVQQEELRQTNAELEEKALQLEERNLSIEQAREAISLKAKELEVSSKYKSEFLANMSHELRTPLNSILILARILKENRPENLNEDQIKYAGVIHNAGNDLLTLINDILDLSKIESGKVDLILEPVKPESVAYSMESLFSELAKSKHIEFSTLLGNNLPDSIITDQSRVEQVAKNLLSNAFKFTPEHGKITFSIQRAAAGTLFYSDQLKDTSEDILAIAVTDTGIGIAESKQKLIFEAFQQEDGSTSRKYGGTGLGLSISKELANIMGGEIQLKSKPGEGSTFTFFIPEKNAFQNEESLQSGVQQESVIPKAPVREQPAVAAPHSDTQTLLIIEDDVTFADVLSDYAREKGFRPILAHSGDTGLEMALSELPDAIVLDIMLPVMDGWAVLKKLKADARTKHIPVHMMSAGNEKESKAVQEGAIGFLKKPVEKDELDKAFDLLHDTDLKGNFKSVLVIEDQELQSRVLTEQLTEKGVDVKQAFTGQEALSLLEDQMFDCIILDLKLPDISGFDLLDKIKQQPALAHIPVIINTAMELDQDKMSHIMKYTDAMVLKSNKSNDRLIDEVSLFIHKLKQDGISIAGNTTTTKVKSVSTIEKVLKDKTVLITDDDMRNIFALSSALQVYDLKIIIANNGREALEKLAGPDTIDIVLMDIMMPEMDGYEAMKAIRMEKRFAKLPIIALTAKAMKNDREKCIEAGANDYISKPVDMDKLLSMLRVWLS